MKKVFESLEKVIADMNLTIIDRYEDEFCIVAAVSHPKKGVFVVYTTKIIASMDPSFALKMFRTTKHLPFKSVTSDKNGTRSFISSIYGLNRNEQGQIIFLFHRQSSPILFNFLIYSS